MAPRRKPVSCVVKDTYNKCVAELVSKNDERRLEALKVLVSLLSSDGSAKEYFCVCKGTDFLIKQFSCEENRNIAQAFLFALACSADDHAKNQKKLQNTTLIKYIHRILQHPRILKYPTFLNCSLLVISTLASQNPVGQCLVKKHGCFFEMISLFDDILRLAKKNKSEVDIKTTFTWEILCRAIGTCMNNPLQAENQQEASQLFPKILEYLSSLDYSGKNAKKSIHSCLNFLMLAISGNEHNQCYFAKCGGIQYLQLLIKHYNIFLEDGYILQSCLMVLTVVVSNDQCSQEASKQNVMPFLLGILQKKILMDRIPLMLLLCHILQHDEESFKCFKDYSGPILIQECIKGGEESKDLEMVVKHVLQMCLDRESLPKQKQQNRMQRSASPTSVIEESISSDESTIGDTSSEVQQHSALQKSIAADSKNVTRGIEDNEWISKAGSASEITHVRSLTTSNTKRLKSRPVNLETAFKRNYVEPWYNAGEIDYRRDSFSIRSKEVPRKHFEENTVGHVELLLFDLIEMESDSDALSFIPQESLDSTKPAKVFLPSDQCDENDGSFNSLSFGSKSKINQAGNLPRESLSKSSISVSPRKRPYSLISDAALDARSHCTKLQHAPPNSQVQSKSESEVPSKIPSKNICEYANIAKPDCLFSKLDDQIANFISGINERDASLEPSSSRVKSTFSPSVPSKSLKKSQGTISRCDDAHHSKNSSQTPATIQKEHMDLDSSASGISKARSYTQLDNTGDVGKSSLQFTPSSCKERYTITQDCSELKMKTPRSQTVCQKNLSEPCKPSIQVINLDSCSSPINNGSKEGATTLHKHTHQLPKEKSKKNVTKENAEILHGSTAMISKPFESVNAGSPSGSECTVSIYSTDEGSLLGDNDFQGTDAKELCTPKNSFCFADAPHKTPHTTPQDDGYQGKDAKELCTPKNSFYFDDSSHETLHTTPGPSSATSEDPICVTDTPCSRNMDTGAHITNFEIVLVTPHASNSCYFQTMSFHQTTKQNKTLNCKSPPDTGCRKPSTSDCEIQMTGFKAVSYKSKSSVQENEIVDIVHDPKYCTPNLSIIDDSGTAEMERIHSTSTNKHVLTVEISEKSASCNEIVLPKITDGKQDEEQKLRSPVGERVTKMFPYSEPESIRKIPLSLMEVENLQAGIKKFGLHFGMIRKSYSFLPMRTSKDLFIAWKELHKIIGHPEEHQVNENMLEVSSDEALYSE